MAWGLNDYIGVGTRGWGGGDGVGKNRHKIPHPPPPLTHIHKHFFKFSSDKLFNELNIFCLKRTRKFKRYLKFRTRVQGIRNLRVDGLEGSICNNNFLCGLYYEERAALPYVQR